MNMNDTIFLNATFLNRTYLDINDTLIPLSDEILTPEDEKNSVWLYGIAFGFILACAFILIFCRICKRKSKKSRNLASRNTCNVELGQLVARGEHPVKSKSTYVIPGQNYMAVPSIQDSLRHVPHSNSAYVAPETNSTYIPRPRDSLVVTTEIESITLTQKATYKNVVPEANSFSSVAPEPKVVVVADESSFKIVAPQTNFSSVTPEPDITAPEFADITPTLESEAFIPERESKVETPESSFQNVAPETNSVYVTPAPESLYVTAELDSILLTPPKAKIVTPEITSSTDATTSATPPSPYTPSKSRYGRNRIPPVKTYLGEKPVYEYDEDGLPTLVNVQRRTPGSPEAKTPPRTPKSKTARKSREETPRRRKAPSKKQSVSIGSEDDE
uniref:Uncharacterized protein n=1 Tax=Panagrolaimus sp. ES5 TaxID=591445 RepID=A0AC34FH80_9BILA